MKRLFLTIVGTLVFSQASDATGIKTLDFYVPVSDVQDFSFDNAAPYPSTASYSVSVKTDIDLPGWDPRLGALNEVNLSALLTPHVSGTVSTFRGNSSACLIFGICITKDITVAANVTGSVSLPGSSFTTSFLSGGASIPPLPPSVNRFVSLTLLPLSPPLAGGAVVTNTLPFIGETSVPVTMNTDFAMTYKNSSILGSDATLIRWSGQSQVVGDIKATYSIDTLKASATGEKLEAAAKFLDLVSDEIERKLLARSTVEFVTGVKSGKEVSLRSMVELARGYTAQFYKALDIPTSDTIDWANGVLDAASIAADLITALKSKDPEERAKAAFSVIAASTAKVTKLASLGLDLWAHDPPRSDYTVQTDVSAKLASVAAQFEALSAAPEFAPESQELKFIAATLRLSVGTTAALTAYERYQGALQAGDFTAAFAQAALADKILNVTGDPTRSIGALAASLAAKYDAGRAPLSADDIAQISDLFDILRKEIGSDPAKIADFFSSTPFEVPSDFNAFIAAMQAALPGSLSSTIDPFSYDTAALTLADQNQLLMPNGDPFPPGSGPPPPPGVPEPASWLLLCAGLFGLGAWRRSRAVPA